MIDWAHIDTLKQDVGAEAFDEIVGLFLEEVDAFVARLVDHSDPATLGDDLHFIKGSAAGLGFRSFVADCLAGERMCQAGQADQVDLPAILASYADSKRLFLEQLPTALAS